jgi:parvulin-like peptidyl-prolyl isomerase
MDETICRMTTDDTPPSITELALYGLLPGLRRNRLWDDASKDVVLSEDEALAAWEGFCNQIQQAKGRPDAGIRKYLGCSQEQLKEVAVREARIRKWKHEEFGHMAEEQFQKTKHLYTRFVYSFLRVSDAGLAHELWIRIREGEDTFSGIASKYGEGMERHTGGIMGPVAAGALHPDVAASLESAAEGQLLDPVPSGRSTLVMRLEKRFPQTLTPRIKEALVEELSIKHAEGVLYGK